MSPVTFYIEEVMEIKIKRVYEDPSAEDGRRILVDRLWPRGMTKEKAKIDIWLKEIAPSNELRIWYAHEKTRWDEFRKRYRDELDRKPEKIDLMLKEIGKNTITLVYSSTEKELNNAVALKEILEEIGGTGRI